MGPNKKTAFLGRILDIDSIGPSLRVQCYFIHPKFEEIPREDLPQEQRWFTEINNSYDIFENWLVRFKHSQMIHIKAGALYKPL